MAKVTKAFFCNECGAESPKWFGRCTSCDAWSSCSEEVISVKPTSTTTNLRTSRSILSSKAISPKPININEVDQENFARIDLHSGEVNRVLGGGLVLGSMVLIAGEPGIGKSTLSLQLALKLFDKKVLYCSGEESAGQIKLRADRLGIENSNCMVYCETNLENIILQIGEQIPDIVVIDSIQTLYSEYIESSAGTLTQIRECSSSLLRVAKENSIPIILIGHITKDGAIAGPKVLEHIVDVVLQFDGDGNQTYRVLRSQKNRFGATHEIGVFEMVDKGLREVENPSEILISQYDEPLSGIAISASIEGNRPYLIEAQALVSNSPYPTAQRSATGFDYKRMSMLLAVLEKRLGFRIATKDVFLNIAGGIKVSDAGLDLALVAAIISSTLDIPIPSGYCFAGEVGLSGEVRPALRTEIRIAEAQRLGFEKIIVSKYAKKAISKEYKNIEIIYVNKVSELSQSLF